MRLLVGATGFVPATNIARDARKVSIAWRADTAVVTEERYRGGTLWRLKRGDLRHIALVREADQPVYRTAWVAPRSPEAYRRLYADEQAALEQIAGGRS